MLAGEIDVAAIDSNVLALSERAFPWLRERLRVVESWGPHPIQPVVLSASLTAELGEAVTTALLDIMNDSEVGPALSRLGLKRCVPIEDELYAEERAALESLGQLPPRHA